MNDRLEIEQARGRGGATALLENSILQAAFAILEETYTKTLFETPLEAATEREEIYRLYQSLRTLRRQIRSVAETSKMP